MPSPSPQPGLAERDGCGCPPWVRCAHWDGQVLWLFKRDSWLLAHGLTARRDGAADVLLGELTVEPDNCWSVRGGALGCILSPTTTSSSSHTTFSAAEAEFFRQERELLGQA